MDMPIERYATWDERSLVCNLQHISFFLREFQIPPVVERRFPALRREFALRMRKMIDAFDEMSTATMITEQFGEIVLWQNARDLFGRENTEGWSDTMFQVHTIPTSPYFNAVLATMKEVEQADIAKVVEQKQNAKFEELFGSATDMHDFDGWDFVELTGGDAFQ
jgi:hypothetical protein